MSTQPKSRSNQPLQTQPGQGAQHLGPLDDIGRLQQSVHARGVIHSQQTSHARHHGYAPPMGHSRSEGNIAVHRRPADIGPPTRLMRSPVRALPRSSTDGSTSLLGESVVLDNPQRGRFFDRTPSLTKATPGLRGRSLSPVKSSSSSALSSDTKWQTDEGPPVPPKDLEQILEDDEDTEVEGEQRQKRSRSPMKQMFGPKGWLDRVPTDKAIKVEISRKQSLKNWSGKIKQRAGDMVRINDATTFMVQESGTHISTNTERRSDETHPRNFPDPREGHDDGSWW